MVWKGTMLPPCTPGDRGRHDNRILVADLRRICGRFRIPKRLGLELVLEVPADRHP